MPRILVTDGQERSALAVVRSLGRVGHEMIVASTGVRPLAGSSRHARESIRVPDPMAHPSAHREAIAEIVRTHAVDLLIPISDTSIDILLDLRESCPGLLIPFPSRSSYERASDKARLMELAAGLGVAVPAQTVFASPSLLVEGLPGCEFPLVLKPSRSSVRTGGGMAKTGVVIADTVGEAVAAAGSIPPEAFPVLAQELVRGHGRGVFLLLWGGELLASFAHRRLREKPPTGGVSVYREADLPDPDLLEGALDLLRALEWNGVAMVEFKEHAESGRAYLMEINGRFWGSLQLAIDAGVDFPRLLVEAATGGSPKPVTGYRTGVRSRWLWGDVDHLLAALRMPAGVRGRIEGMPGRLGAVLRFLVPWRPGDRFEVLRLADPRPFLRETVDWFRDVLRLRAED